MTGWRRTGTLRVFAVRRGRADLWFTAWVVTGRQAKELDAEQAPAGDALTATPEE